MTWFAFQGLNSGKAINLAGTQEKQASLEGFHGYGTEAQAESNPNAVNILTKIQADAFISDYNSAVSQGAQPGGPNDITTPQGVVGAVTGVNFSSIQDALTAFYDKVTDGKMWRSLAWILLGVILMITGVALWIKGSITPATALGLAGI